MSERTEFDALVEEFYAVWFRYHPDTALALGLTGIKVRLPAADDDELSALGSWLENLIVALGEIDPTALDADSRLDYRLLLESAQLEYQDLLTRDWRHLDPLRFLPVQEIFELTLHPPEDLARTLVELLRAVPAYLRSARARLAELPSLIAPEMVDVAVEDAESGVQYLDRLRRNPWLIRHCADCDDLEASFDAATEALNRYADFLCQELATVAKGGLGCGEAHLLRLMERRHFISSSLEEMRAELEGLYAGELKRFQSCCAASGISADAQSAYRHLSGQALLDDEARLAFCRDESERQRAYLSDGDIIDLPEQALKMVERPLCPRPKQCDTGYVEQADRSAGSLLMPLSGDTPLPPPALRRHCLEHGWGGAHLLAFFAGKGAAAHSLPRRVGAVNVFADAWKLYITALLSERGYWVGDDALLDSLERMQVLTLALLDLGLNQASIDGEAAAEKLAEWEPVAESVRHRILDLVRRPGDAAAAVLGAEQWSRARESLAARPDFDLKGFHAQLLSHGAIPPALLLPHAFGESP